MILSDLFYILSGRKGNEVVLEMPRLHLHFSFKGKRNIDFASKKGQVEFN
jgi:hypothetical protein